MSNKLKVAIFAPCIAGVLLASVGVVCYFAGRNMSRFFEALEWE